MITEIKANYINIFIKYQNKERKYKEIIQVNLIIYQNLNEEIDYLKNQLNLAIKELKLKVSVIEEGNKIIQNKSKNEEDLLKLLVENIVLRVENDSLVTYKMMDLNNNLDEEKHRSQTTPNNNKYRNFIKDKGRDVKRNRNLISFFRDKTDFINSTSSCNNICETFVGNKQNESTCLCKKEFQNQKMKFFSNFDNCHQNINIPERNLKRNNTPN